MLQMTEIRCEDCSRILCAQFKSYARNSRQALAFAMCYQCTEKKSTKYVKNEFDLIERTEYQKLEKQVGNLKTQKNQEIKRHEKETAQNSQKYERQKNQAIQRHEKQKARNSQKYEQQKNQAIKKHEKLTAQNNQWHERQKNQAIQRHEKQTAQNNQKHERQKNQAIQKHKKQIVENNRMHENKMNQAIQRHEKQKAQINQKHERQKNQAINILQNKMKKQLNDLQESKAAVQINLNSKNQKLQEQLTKCQEKNNQAELLYQQLDKQAALYSKFISNQTKKSMELFVESSKQIRFQLKYFNNLIEASYKKMYVQIQQFFFDLITKENTRLIKIVVAQVEKCQSSISKTKQYHKENQQHLNLLNLQFSVKHPQNTVTEQTSNFMLFEEKQSAQILTFIQTKIQQLQSKHQKITKLLNLLQTDSKYFLSISKREQQQKEVEKQSNSAISKDTQQEGTVKSQDLGLTAETLVKQPDFSI